MKVHIYNIHELGKTNLLLLVLEKKLLLLGPSLVDMNIKTYSDKAVKC